jgi:hypothetical protein
VSIDLEKGHGVDDMLTEGVLVYGFAEVAPCAPRCIIATGSGSRNTVAVCLFNNAQFVSQTQFSAGVTSCQGGFIGAICCSASRSLVLDKWKDQDKKSVIVLVRPSTWIAVRRALWCRHVWASWRNNLAGALIDVTEPLCNHA